MKHHGALATLRPIDPAPVPYAWPTLCSDFITVPLQRSLLTDSLSPSLPQISGGRGAPEPSISPAASASAPAAAARAAAGGRSRRASLAASSARTLSLFGPRSSRAQLTCVAGPHAEPSGCLSQGGRDRSAPHLSGVAVIHLPGAALFGLGHWPRNPKPGQAPQCSAPSVVPRRVRPRSRAGTLGTACPISMG